MIKFHERLFVVAMLFYTTGAVLPFLLGPQDRLVRGEGDLTAFTIQLLFYLGTFWFMAMNWRTMLRGVLNAKWIICLTLVALASATWSQDPAFTLRRSAVLVATTAFGVYFGSRFTVPQQLRLLATTFALVILASFLIAIFFPGHGVDHFMHPGHWQGAFPQKNILARAMVLAVLVFYLVRPAMWPWMRWVGIAGAIVLLAFSRSVTGGLVFCAMVAMLPLYRLWRARVTIAIPVSIGIAVVIGSSILAVTVWSSEAFQLVHRSSDLTGRTDLWDSVIMAIMKRPFLGYGFNAFWQGMTGDSALVLMSVRWPVLHAHNGFLDLMLDLGLLGLVTFVVGYIALWWRATALVRREGGPVPVWLCSYLLFMFLYNLSESAILVQNDLFWVLYTATAVSLFLNVPATSATAGMVRDHG